MYKILKLNKIHEKAESILAKGYIVSDNETAPDGIIVRSFKMLDYKPAENLLAIARAGAGVNNIPYEDYKNKGIVVFNTPGANANAVKELVICSMLLATRDIVKGIGWTSTIKGKGKDVGPLVEKGKEAFGGTEIMGKTLGVVGLGAIGAMVAQSAIALKMKIVGYDPYLAVDTPWTLASDFKRVKELNPLYAASDFITLHSPLTDETKGMINAESIAKMKDGVIIINCARGELVNNADIIEAIKSGKVRRYVTDFPSDELIGVDNVLTIPHLGASTEEAETNCAIMAADELKEYLETGNIVNSVNYPALSLPRTGKARITLNLTASSSAAKLVPEILLKHCVATTGMMSAARNGVAYTIIDIDMKLPAEAAAEIEAIDGVLKFRII